MPRGRSRELEWFIERSEELAVVFLNQWIAIDSRRLAQGLSRVEDVVVVGGDTLDEVADAAQLGRHSRPELCFAFVQAPLRIQVVARG